LLTCELAIDQYSLDETDVEGAFDKAIATPGGSSKTDILFPASVRHDFILSMDIITDVYLQAAGSLEVEVNSTATNAVTVKKNASPVAPPTGFLFVDPSTFIISTDKATNTATDQVKVDYIFTPAVLAAVDPSKAVIGKLDEATKQFITDVKTLNAEFEFEEDENEWSLVVPDLNGEWAILIPQTAVKKQITTLQL